VKRIEKLIFLKGFVMRGMKSSRVVFLMCLVVLTTATLHSQEESGRSIWNWVNSDDGQKIEVRVENKVDFNDDYSDVAAIPADGALRIFDSRGSRARRLVVTRGTTGELRREYSVNGQTQSFDAEARDWLRAVLLQAVRQGGLDARNRAQRILAQRGVRGLTDELAYVKGDYVRRIYFEALLHARGVTDQELRTALRNASTTIKADYERAQLLMQVAGVFLTKKDLLPDYLNAASSIDSGYEKSRVLTAAITHSDLSKEALTSIVQSAATINSDYEKSKLLITASDQYQKDAQLRTAWLGAVRTIGSDYEYRRALTGALKVSELSVEALSGLVSSAAQIKSDYEKASFLLDAMNLYRADAGLRAAFMETAKTIGSEYERGRVQKRFDKANF
jgi:hypothetical protein